MNNLKCYERERKRRLLWAEIAGASTRGGSQITQDLDIEKKREASKVRVRHEDTE